MLEPVTTTLSSRLMILTNELPRLGDSSGALAGRMILLRLTRDWSGREDRALTDRLLTELPGILLWSIEGWRRLSEQGWFTQPGSGQDMLDAFGDLTSPVSEFLRDRCEVSSAAEVVVADLYEEWKRWCEEKGRKEPGTIQVFGRDLGATVPTLKRVQLRDGEQRVWAYRGVGSVLRR